MPSSCEFMLQGVSSSPSHNEQHTLLVQSQWIPSGGCDTFFTSPVDHFNLTWLELCRQSLIYLTLDLSYLWFSFPGWGFPDDPVVKNTPANAEDLGSIPGLG